MTQIVEMTGEFLGAKEIELRLTDAVLEHGEFGSLTMKDQFARSDSYYALDWTLQDGPLAVQNRWIAEQIIVTALAVGEHSVRLPGPMSASDLMGVYLRFSVAKGSHVALRCRPAAPECRLGRVTFYVSFWTKSVLDMAARRRAR